MPAMRQGVGPAVWTSRSDRSLHTASIVDGGFVAML
jgi:hypothetical protein